MSATTAAVSRESTVVSVLPTMVTVLGLYRLGSALFSLLIISFQRSMLTTMGTFFGGQAQFDEFTGGVAGLMEQLHLILYAEILFSGAVGTALLVSSAWLKTRVKWRACVGILVFASVPVSDSTFGLGLALLSGVGLWAITRPSIRETFAK